MDEMILKDCKIFDNKRIISKDIHIRDGKIHKINKVCEHSICNVIDCKGKLVLPGFVDSHIHIPGNMLYNMYGINLSDGKCLEDYISILKKFSHGYLKEKAVLGFGWYDDIIYKSEEYREQKSFSKILDDIFPDNPVVLYSLDFHSAWCNTLALEMMGITINTETPAKGSIEHTKSGELLGILRGRATEYIKNREDIFSFSDFEFENAFKKFQNELVSYGITSVNTFMFIGINPQRAWTILKKMEHNNELYININGYISAEPEDELEVIVERFKYMQHLNSPKIRINTVKIYIDGVVENMTALLKEPYTFDEKKRGMLIWGRKKLYDLCYLMEEKGIQIHAHAIGDAAVKVFLETLLEAQSVINNRFNRHVVAHIQLIDLEDIELFVKTRAIACVQPFWINNNIDASSFDYIMLGERAKTEYRIQSFIKNGIILTSSSDSPVTESPNPIEAIYNAVNRNSEECANVVDMIFSYTYNGAYQLWRENEIGTIKEGMNADLVVFSENIYELDKSNIGNIKCVYTLSDGKVVYKND